MTEDILPLEQEPEVRGLIARALAEDVGTGDATTLALVDAKSTARAWMALSGSRTYAAVMSDHGVCHQPVTM